MDFSFIFRGHIIKVVIVFLIFNVHLYLGR